MRILYFCDGLLPPAHRDQKYGIGTLSFSSLGSRRMASEYSLSAFGQSPFGGEIQVGKLGIGSRIG